MPNEHCETNCSLSVRVDRLEKDFESEKEARSKSHAEFYDRIRKLESAQAVNETKLDTIVEKLDSISVDLTTIKEKPSKRWDTVIAAIITGIVGFLLARFGLG